MAKKYTRCVTDAKRLAGYYIRPSGMSRVPTAAFGPAAQTERRSMTHNLIRRTCSACGAIINPRTAPNDRSCNRCGHDPDNAEQVAEREEAVDNAMRTRREEERDG